MARKPKVEKAANHERWLVSYADFITLLFAFFTTLYAISYVDRQKMEKFDHSVSEAFNAPPVAIGVPNIFTRMAPGGASPDQIRIDIFPSAVVATPAPAQNESLLPESTSSPMGSILEPMASPTPMPKKDGEIKGEGEEPGEGFPEGTPKALSQIYQDLRHWVEEFGLDERIILKMEQRGVVISLAEAGFFDSGIAKVRPESLPLLSRIGDTVEMAPYPVRVEGHTDDVPIHNSRFPSNWELSTARATNVIRYFIETHSTNPVRISAAGYGEYHPVATNETAEGREKNRRVDVVILSASAAVQEPN